PPSTRIAVVPYLRAYVTAPTGHSGPMRREPRRPRRGDLEVPTTRPRGTGSVGAGAGERPDLQLRVLLGVRLLLGEHGAEPAEQEAGRDGDQARVLQREPGEVDVGEHRRGVAGDDGREQHQADGDDETAVDRPQRALGGEPLPE